MKRFVQGTAAALGLLAALAVGAPAQQPGPAPQGEEGREGRRRRQARRHEREIEMHAIGRLKLSDEQRAQFRILRENLRQNTELQRDELHQLLAAREEGGPLNEAQVERVRQARAELRQAAERNYQEALDMLTPEQRGQIEQWKQTWKQRREERRNAVKSREP